MVQSKVTLTEELAEFIKLHKRFGFKDQSSMIRNALERLKREYEREMLENSATLYAKLYEDDREAKEWIEDIDTWSKDVSKR